MDKRQIDVVNAWQTYIAFNGDVGRTAAAVQVPPEAIARIEAQECWRAKLDAWQGLAQGDTKDHQIALNRAVSYVQSHRLRTLLDGIVSFFGERPVCDLMKSLTVKGKHGDEIKTRAVTDLVKAAETAQLMCARALGDTAGEHPKADENTGSQIALQVMAAMNAAGQVGLDSAQVVRKSLALPSHVPPAETLSAGPG